MCRFDANETEAAPLAIRVLYRPCYIFISLSIVFYGNSEDIQLAIKMNYPF